MKHRSLAPVLVLALLMILGTALPGIAAGTTQPGGFDVKFSGVIQTVGATGGVWTIGGIPVQTTAATQVILEGVTEAKAGMWANVMARRTAAGALTASKIIVYAAPANTPVVKDGEVTVYGPIEAFSAAEWTIAGVRFTITKDTRIMGTPSKGLLAQGVGIQTGTGLQAKLLKVSWVEPRRGVQTVPVPKTNPGLGPAQFKGVVEQMPAGLIGMWRISGRTVEVTAATNIQQNKGQAKVGAKVHVVTAPPAANGQTPKASLIQVLDGAKGPGDQVKGKPADQGKPEDQSKPEDKGKPDLPGKPADKGNPGKGSGH